MTDLCDAALAGDLEHVTLLIEQGTDKNQIGGYFGDTALSAAAKNNHLSVVQYLVEQGADTDKPSTKRSGFIPLHYASRDGHLDVARYLLEQGADRDKAKDDGWTSLHLAVANNHIETAKLIMVYGADLNARTNDGELPIDVARTEEIKQAIRDEPRRRMDHGHKRATEQDRHPNAATSASAQHEDEEEREEQSNKRPRLEEDAQAEEGKIAEEDEDSEPSDDEDCNWIASSGSSCSDMLSSWHGVDVVIVVDIVSYVDRKCRGRWSSG